MFSRGVQQEVIVRRLPDLLRAVYEGRLRVPSSEQPPWDDKRRLKLLEAIYQGLPVGSLTVLRTTVELDYRHTLGTVPLQEQPGPGPGSAGDYLVDGIELVTTLFEALGPAFWRNDGARERRPLAPAEARLAFDVQTRTFQNRRSDETWRPTEYALENLFDAERQHVFAKRVRQFSDGERMANRLAHLVDAFFDFNLPVITIASDDVEAVQSALAIRLVPASLPREHQLTTTCWYCDTCAQRIEQPRDGWVEWLVRQEGSQLIGRGLRLVHHHPASPLPQGCQYDDQQEFARDRSTLRDLPLEDFLGPDGLTRLLMLLEQYELPRAEVIEMINRLHVPGYERARFHIPDAVAAGVIELNLPEGFYRQRQIANALEWADREGRKP